MALLEYVDDILAASSTAQVETKVRQYLRSKFKLKDFGSPKYFLGIEIGRCFKGIMLCQRKNALDLITEHGLLSSKPTSTLMEYNHKITATDKKDLLDDGTVRR